MAAGTGYFDDINHDTTVIAWSAGCAAVANAAVSMFAPVAIRMPVAAVSAGIASTMGKNLFTVPGSQTWDIISNSLSSKATWATAALTYIFDYMHIGQYVGVLPATTAENLIAGGAAGFISHLSFIEQYTIEANKPGKRVHRGLETT